MGLDVKAQGPQPCGTSCRSNSTENSRTREY